MKKTVLSVSLITALVYGAQAYEVYCNFGGGLHTASSVWTDTVEYRVEVGPTDAKMSNFYVGYFIAPDAGSIYAKDSLLNPVGFTQGPDGAVDAQQRLFVPDNSVATLDSSTASLHWAFNTDLVQGTYYFGYKVKYGQYDLLQVGWDGNGPGQVSWEVWADPVSGTLNPILNGLGPVHSIVVPEPTSFALIGLGAALLALRRRKV